MMFFFVCVVYKIETETPSSSWCDVLLKLVEGFNVQDERFTHQLYILFSHFITDPLLVLIEYVPFGDLLGYLRKSRGLQDTYFNDPDVKPQTSLTAEQLMRFAWQVADGMLYLSSRKVWLVPVRVCKLYVLLYFMFFLVNI